ncbi:uncharacterized protein FTOL_01770 [Fusarium torulosum]|uniref:Uncharacterized protein n=1 Tax=Fusarium torulosum TaxID=33205 RepID=A0AAE8M0N9_9HYPO|nr:uncharacterized protein FTOL_01770 [Fusarium torulosum]
MLAILTWVSVTTGTEVSFAHENVALQPGTPPLVFPVPLFKWLSTNEARSPSLP